MSPVLPTRKEETRTPATLRRRPGGHERGNLAATPLAASPAPEPGRPPVPAAEAALLWKVQRTRQAVRIEQELVYHPGPSKPLVTLTLRLTTACRGRRKQDGLVQAAYLLRLEVLAASEGARLEGFKLGPWNFSDLDLEAGSIHVTEPLWTGFQPASGRWRGRVLIGDRPRHRLLDLPWDTEALVPGAEPLDE
jgi:hypothetical protein